MSQTTPEKKPWLFMTTLPVCVAMAIWAVADADGMAHRLNGFTTAVFGALGDVYLYSFTFFILLCVFVVFGPFRSIRLGGPEAKMEFSTLSWLSMLFAAGMGGGLLFWGVAEPIIHYAQPPVGEGLTTASAKEAMVISQFHWGLHAWAAYGAAALALAFFGFNRNTPLLPGAPIRTAFPGRLSTRVAMVSNWIAVLAVVFGVVGALAFGVKQMISGFDLSLGWNMGGTGGKLGIMLALVVVAVVSASTGLGQGIKILSNINMTLALVLMVAIVVLSTTTDLLGALMGSTWDYIAAIPSLSAGQHEYLGEEQWRSDWTLTYLVWWVAWVPFVGIFIARISKGRTLRGFITGVVLVPTLFCMIWLGLFGGFALQQEADTGAIVTSVIGECQGVSDLPVVSQETCEAKQGTWVAGDFSTGLFLVIHGLPWDGFFTVVTLFLIFIFLITSMDSATYVLSMLTSRGAANPPVSQKITWGLVLGVLAAPFLFVDNDIAIRSVTVIGAIPFLFVIHVQIVALMRSLWAERRAQSTAAVGSSDGFEGAESTGEEDIHSALSEDVPSDETDDAASETGPPPA